MTIKAVANLVYPSEAPSSPADDPRNEELRRENSRLKTLVVQLSAIIAKNVAASK